MADMSDLLWNSLDSFSGFITSDIKENVSTEHDGIQYTVEDHTPKNKSIILTFQSEDIYKEVWNRTSYIYQSYTSKGENGDIISSTELGLKVTLTFYSSKLKLHVQGEGCAQWKENVFEKQIMNELNSDTENGVQNISITFPKQIIMSTPVKPVQTSCCTTSKCKYLQRAANRKDKQMKTVEEQLAIIRMLIQDQVSGQTDVHTLNEQLKQSREKTQSLTQNNQQQNETIKALRTENKILKKDISQATAKLNKSMADKDKSETDLAKTKASLVKANTETFFQEDTIKSLKADIAKIEQERSSFLKSLTESNYKFDVLKAELDEFACQFRKSADDDNDKSEHENKTHAKTIEQEECSNQPYKSYAEAAKAVPSKIPIPDETHRQHSIDEPSDDNGLHDHDILLIGSSLFKYINKRGLMRNVRISTNRGAHIEEIFATLQRITLTRYKSIVLYCGGNDAAAGHTDTEIYWKYADILNYIQDNFEGINIHVCGLMPRRDVDTACVNETIYRLCENYNVNYIHSYDSVVSRNGQIIASMYNNDCIHLSHRGTAALLRSINKSINIIPQKSEQRWTKSQQQAKCFNCGEPGHISSKCRHQNGVSCWSCGNAGHKSKYCTVC